jgi:hypothetical protein
MSAPKSQQHSFIHPSIQPSTHPLIDSCMFISRYFLRVWAVFRKRTSDICEQRCPYWQCPKICRFSWNSKRAIQNTAGLHDTAVSSIQTFNDYGKDPISARHINVVKRSLDILFCTVIYHLENMTDLRIFLLLLLFLFLKYLTWRPGAM